MLVIGLKEKIIFFISRAEYRKGLYLRYLEKSNARTVSLILCRKLNTNLRSVWIHFAF